MPITDSPEIKSIQDIVDQIEIGNVIPILGYDLLLEDIFDGSQDDFLKRLIKIHAGNNLLALEEEKELSGYELINAYYHSLPNTGVFKRQLSRTIQEERFNLNLTPDSLRKLVDIKHFKLFINATITNSLELAMNTHRAVGNNVNEIKSSYQVYKYHPTEPTDLPEEAPSRFQMDKLGPTIYNLFGIHDDQGYEYVLTDADYIELIYDLILNSNQKFKNILSYLKQGNLLFLGCNFPDWFFRFFIRVCVSDRLDLVSPIKGKSVIDSLADPSRSVFIGLYKIHTLNVNCNELIDAIYQKLQQEPGTPGLFGDSGNNSVFISYCRADEKVAGDIGKQFNDKYIDYFLDKNNLRLGDSLSGKITEAIDRACFFMPIVSDNITVSVSYIWKEWKYAVDTGKNIIPVFKNFVDIGMLDKQEFPISIELREKILNKNNTLGIIPEGENNILPEKALKDIKLKQYLSRVSGNKV